MGRRFEEKPHKRRYSDANKHIAVGDCELKQGDATAHLWEWWKRRHWQHSMPACLWSDRSSGIATGNAKWLSLLGRHSGGSWKAKQTLTMWSSSWTPRYLLTWVESYVHTKNHTLLFTAALSIIVQIWKQPRCPSVDEWIHKLWSTQTMEYSSALKGNELSRRGKTWRRLKCIWLSVRSQPEKATDCMLPTLWQFGKGKLWKQ